MNPDMLTTIAGCALMWYAMATVFVVEEGYVGVTYRAGRLLEEMAEPGVHMHRYPFVDSMKQVQVTMQTDNVTDVPCGTKSGVVVFFDRIEVVNQLSKEHVWPTVQKFTVEYDQPLIFNNIHHAVNEFCSSHTLQEIYVDLFDTIDEHLIDTLQNHTRELAPGITIMAVRVTKPQIPEEILANYVRMEAERTKLLIEVQHQKVVVTEAETARKRAQIEAEKEAMVAKIRTDAQIIEQRSKQTISAIEDNTTLARARSQVDAKLYEAEMQAKGNALLHTPEYIEVVRYQSISNNTKVYFGPDIPGLFVQN